MKPWRQSQRLLLWAAVFCCAALVNCDPSDQVCNAEDGTCQEKCTDTHEKCAAWAKHGECSLNPPFMKQHCAWTCGVCPVASLVHFEDENCNDLHPKCDEWAGMSECVANPSYMLSACKASCRQCVNTTKLREEGMDEMTILKTVGVVKSDFGKTQDQSSGEEQRKIVSLLKNLDRYKFHNVSLMPLDHRRKCRNDYPTCAFWASTGECHANLPFMMSGCALACRFCGDRQLQYQRCKDERGEGAPLVTAGALHRRMQRYLDNGKVKLVSSDKKKESPTNQDDPWVLKWDNFLSDKECDHLVKLMKDADWQPSVQPVREGALNPIGPVRRQSKSAYSSKGKDDDKVLNKLRTALSKFLEASSERIEPLEFVHYSLLQSFGMHHDFTIHDTWLPAGPRVLSVFVCLTDVEQGGAFGFPDLDWLLVPPKKGQLLVWPNVLSSDPNKPNPVMLSESLPVTKGEKYGIHTWVRLYDHEAARKLDCT